MAQKPQANVGKTENPSEIPQRSSTLLEAVASDSVCTFFSGWRFTQNQRNCAEKKKLINYATKQHATEEVPGDAVFLPASPESCQS